MDRGTLYVVGDDGVPHIGLQYLGASNWTQARFDLTQFAGSASLKVEFEIFMDSGHPGVWLVDDVELSELPPPAAFGKIAPANGAIVPEITPSISWASSDDADGYEYCVDTTNNNTCDGTWTSTSATAASLNGLNRNTTYWWQVRSLNAVGMTEANGGTWWTFTTAGPPTPSARARRATGRWTCRSA